MCGTASFNAVGAAWRVVPDYAPSSSAAPTGSEDALVSGFNAAADMGAAIWAACFAGLLSLPMELPFGMACWAGLMPVAAAAEAP
jgi:NO-binding membrane sensor protein with MHYT domain